MSILSEEELAYFKKFFSFDADTTENSLARHSLSVATEVPQVFFNILENAKLTLLAEISYYRLLFPLTIKKDDLGRLSLELGIPEVIDLRGGERSWRLHNAKDITVIENDTTKVVEVLSLSSTGITIKMPQELKAKVLRLTQLILPNGIHIDMVFEPVRSENGVVAAKISAEGESAEMLRQFLFSEHKTKHSHLYEK